MVSFFPLLIFLERELYLNLFSLIFDFKTNTLSENEHFNTTYFSIYQYILIMA